MINLMKHSSGFSTVELILFLCIGSIIIFLAIPFIRSYPLTSSIYSQDTTTDISVESSVPELREREMDANKTQPLSQPD